MNQKTKNQIPSDDHYASKIANSKREIKKLVTAPEFCLFEKYEMVMINESLSDATRSKHFETLLSLTRMLSKKSWLTLTQNDIDELTSNVMRAYSYNGRETNTTYDHKKILKIFFRWVKLGDRSFRNVGNPPELKNVKLKQVPDKIVREELITEEDIANLISACNNLRERHSYTSITRQEPDPGNY